MKGEITLKILEAIADFGGRALDTTEAIIGAGYGASSGAINRRFYKLQLGRHSRRYVAEREFEELQKLQSLIYKLKRDGLILL